MKLNIKSDIFNPDRKFNTIVKTHRTLAYIIDALYKAPKKIRYDIAVKITELCMDVNNDVMLANRLDNTDPDEAGRRLEKQQHARECLLLISNNLWLCYELALITANQLKTSGAMLNSLNGSIAKWIESDSHKL